MPVYKSSALRLQGFICSSLSRVAQSIVFIYNETLLSYLNAKTVGLCPDSFTWFQIYIKRIDLEKIVLQQCCLEEKLILVVHYKNIYLLLENHITP